MTGGEEFEPRAPDVAPPFLSGEEMGPFVDVSDPPIACVIRKTSSPMWGPRR